MKTEKLQSTSQALDQFIIKAQPPKNEHEALLLNLLMAIRKISAPDPKAPARNFFDLIHLHDEVSRLFPDKIPPGSTFQIRSGTHHVYQHNRPQRRPEPVTLK